MSTTYWRPGRGQTSRPARPARGASVVSSDHPIFAAPQVVEERRTRYDRRAGHTWRQGRTATRENRVRLRLKVLAANHVHPAAVSGAGVPFLQKTVVLRETLGQIQRLTRSRFLQDDAPRGGRTRRSQINRLRSVSYTHLTLPTTILV